MPGEVFGRRLIRMLQDPVRLVFQVLPELDFIAFSPSRVAGGRELVQRKRHPRWSGEGPGRTPIAPGRLVATIAGERSS